MKLNLKDFISKYSSKFSKFSKYSKYSKMAGLVLLVVILGIVLVISSKMSKSDSNNNETEVITAAGDSAGKSGSGDNKLQKDAYPEINTLVKDYFDARVACDMDKLGKLLNSMDNITLEQLQQDGEYIESYQNIECYTKEGPTEGTYVVYVYYENKILNIETLVPGSVILYVVRDPETNGVYIYNGIREGEISTYIDALASDEDVIAFNENVNTKMQEACEKDPALKNFYDMLLQGAGSTTDNTETTTQETTSQ